MPKELSIFVARLAIVINKLLQQLNNIFQVWQICKTLRISFMYLNVIAAELYGICVITFILFHILCKKNYENCRIRTQELSYNYIEVHRFYNYTSCRKISCTI